VRIDVLDHGNAARAAAYAGKYVSKTFEGDDRAKGRKRYLRQQGLEVPVTRGGAASLDEVKAAVDEIGADYVFISGDSGEWQGPRMVWGSW
jgi:hypothetical protein